MTPPANTTAPRAGVSFLALLALLFIGLKLGRVITWSWWWVLAPIWGQVAIGLALAAGVVLYHVVKIWREERRG